MKRGFSCGYLIRDPAVLRFPSFRATRVKVGQDTLQAEKEDQEMAEACKRLIKNCIICWNYLYLSQKLAEIDDPAKREELPRVMTHGSATAWWVSESLGRV
jgi:hypothetical protein